MNPTSAPGFTYQGDQQSDANPVNPLVTTQPTTQATSGENAVIKWEASEFVDHEKTFKWFFLLLIGALVLCTGMYFLTDSILSTAVAGIAIVAFGVVAGQKPRTLSYSLLPTTLKIGDKSYSYDDFRAFSVLEEGGISSVVLEPNKRFMPSLNIYFAPEDAERIFDALSQHLPYEEKKQDAVEKLMHKIRF